MCRRLAKLVASLIAVFLFGGMLGAVLVRWAPGFESDERQLDPRLGAGAVEAIQAERAADGDIPAFYFNHLRGMLRGDFGESRSLQAPVRELLADRIPVTAHLASFGLMAAWGAGLSAGCLAALVRTPGAAILPTTVAAAASSVPVALFAFAALYWDLPAWLCIAAAIFPRVYRYTRNALAENAAQVAVAAAHARGVPTARIIACYIVAPAIPRTIALAGVTVSAALGAAAPVEVLAGLPGIGQLAWKAASGRDLPVLVSITMLVTATTLVANAFADLCVSWSDRSVA